MKGKTILLVILSSLYFFNSTITHASEYTFNDEFNQERSDNTLDNSKWLVYPNNQTNNVTIKETQGEVRLSQLGNTSQFPFILSKNPISSNNYAIEIKFQYTNVTYWGTGIALSEEQLTNGGGFSNTDNLTIELWQDKSYGPSMRVSYGEDVTQISNIRHMASISTTDHILKVIRSNYKYKILLDNQPIYTSPSTSRLLKYIWMGNPSRQNPVIPDWTRFRVDYVRVKSLPTPFLDLPWDYQAKNISFDEASLAINSYFDHEYPLLSSGLSELTETVDSVIPFNKTSRDLSISYSKHDGYDFGKLAKVNIGDNVLAAAAGWASFENTCEACGNMIKIDHQNGYQTRYLHLQGEGLIISTPGQKVWVSSKQPIGKVGATGKVWPNGSEGAHIHFDIFQDKDGDGNFENNIPDGVTDPYGWQSENTDPWENFTFTQNSQTKSGNSSFYLWKEILNGLDATLTSNGGIFNIDNANLNFPVNATNQNLHISAYPTSQVKTSSNLKSLGNALSIKAINISGQNITQLQNPFTITFNFNITDLNEAKPLSFENKFLLNTLSIYSSSDGINWIRENTTLNTIENKAYTTISHLSYFALMGERADQIPPVTNLSLSGQMGQSNWFRSNVTVNLTAQDNSSEVDYILYKLDNADWNTYTTPLTVSLAGHHKIEFYSADQEGNIENFKSQEFDIDKIAPEAKLSITNGNSISDIPNNLVVEGLDAHLSNISVNTSGGSNNPIYTITDLAGNTLKIDIRDKTSTKFRVYSLQINNQEVFILPTNQYTWTLRGSTAKSRDIEQLYTQNNSPVLRISYSSRNNQSVIFTKRSRVEVISDRKKGYKTLYIQTNNGQLQTSY